MKTVNLLDSPLKRGEHKLDLYCVAVGGQWVRGHPRYIGHARLSSMGPRLVQEKHSREQYDNLETAEKVAAMFIGSEIEHVITRCFYL